MDKLASPFCKRFYIQGLNTHKDTNNSQIKINNKMSLFWLPQNSVIQKLLFPLEWEENWSPERRKFIIPIQSASFVQPCW